MQEIHKKLQVLLSFIRRFPGFNDGLLILGTKGNFPLQHLIEERWSSRLRKTRGTEANKQSTSTCVPLFYISTLVTAPKVPEPLQTLKFSFSLILISRFLLPLKINVSSANSHWCCYCLSGVPPERWCKCVKESYQLSIGGGKS